jgi:hypothetical protein
MLHAFLGAETKRQNLFCATLPARPQRKSYDGSEQVAVSICTLHLWWILKRALLKLPACKSFVLG